LFWVGLRRICQFKFIFKKDFGLEESFENGDRLSGSFRSNDEVRRLNIDNQIRAAFLMRNKMDLGIAQSSFLAGTLLREHF
jgi:hypothetical protein